MWSKTSGSRCPWASKRALRGDRALGPILPGAEEPRYLEKLALSPAQAAEYGEVESGTSTPRLAVLDQFVRVLLVRAGALGDILLLRRAIAALRVCAATSPVWSPPRRAASSSDPAGPRSKTSLPGTAPMRPACGRAPSPATAGSAAPARRRPSAAIVFSRSAESGRGRFAGTCGACSSAIQALRTATRPSGWPSRRASSEASPRPCRPTSWPRPLRPTRRRRGSIDCRRASWRFIRGVAPRRRTGRPRVSWPSSSGSRPTGRGCSSRAPPTKGRRNPCGLIREPCGLRACPPGSWGPSWRGRASIWERLGREPPGRGLWSSHAGPLRPDRSRRLGPGRPMRSDGALRGRNHVGTLGRAGMLRRFELPEEAGSLDRCLVLVSAEGFPRSEPEGLAGSSGQR